MPPILLSRQAATAPRDAEFPDHDDSAHVTPHGTVGQRAATEGVPGTAPPAAGVHERVLTTVAARICGSTEGRGGGGDPCLQMLCDAVVLSDAAFDTVLARLRSQHGLNDEDLVDCYIPAAACQLGADWAENRRSFAEVTVGTARLIATVRTLGRRWAADAVADWRAPNMAMVVPEAEQHRLGAMIAASRFRRLGVSVQMLLGLPDAAIVARIREGDFDFVSFSLATQERVEQTRRLIQMLRKEVSRMPPVVAGGAVGVNADELKAQLGADHVVSDPEEALRLCGVSIPKRPGGAARTKV